MKTVRRIDPENVILKDRLRATSLVLGDARLPSAPDDLHAADYLDALLGVVQDDGSVDVAWLVLVALTGAYPTADDVLYTVRTLQLESREDAMRHVLESVHARTADSGNMNREMRLVHGGVVVDVTHAAQMNIHSGIQQVVRRTMPIWHEQHAVTFGVWTKNGSILRSPSDEELDRLLRWSEFERSGRAKLPIDPDVDYRASSSPIVVPWRSTLVLAEVPPHRAGEPLFCVARYSGNDVKAVGHDCIPIASADLVPIHEIYKFVSYLTVIKHARQVAAVSESANAEFSGYVESLRSQGIEGPVVSTCREPSGVDDTLGAAPKPSPERSGEASGGDRVPTILSVVGPEPRKNHGALLFAAELLWREGHAFELQFIGGVGWDSYRGAELRLLQAQGRPIEVTFAASDEELAAAYRKARFTVFLSLHEGYGLPVAESLALGTPAVTSNFGATAEFEESGGAILVDPRDDDAIVAALRWLLTDDEAVAQMRARLASRQLSGWDHYAKALWDCLIGS